MKFVAPNPTTVSPILQSAVLLVAIPILSALGLPHPKAEEVLEKLEVRPNRSQAYDLRNRLLALLVTLLRSPGRPAQPPAPNPPSDTREISRKVIDFLMANPGAARSTQTRHEYADRFRHFVLDLAENHPALERTELACAVGIPLDTLRDWLDSERPRQSTEASPTIDEEIKQTQIASIIDGWKTWGGSFTAFCRYVEVELMIEFGRSMISRILSTYADRRPIGRPGRSPDEKGLRDALVKFFPGAQWFEDGSEITITLNDEAFKFNWELVVDGHSAALVGASLRSEEDAQGVIEAFQDATNTTRKKPVALTTDNKAPNHTAEVKAVLGDTLHVETTLGRPQNDAPVEGAFGLFKANAPPLVVQGATNRDLAQCILQLILVVYARTTNHRPRKTRSGKSRVELYRDQVITEAQIIEARAQLEKQRRRQELARKTEQARINPQVRALLDHAFTSLRLDDPTGNMKDALARYPLGVVTAALATFEGKRERDTLPKDVGARYLLGIARNISATDEGLAIAEHLWQRRLALRDVTIQQLEEERSSLVGDLPSRIREIVRRALLPDAGKLRRSFWIMAAAKLIADAALETQKSLFDIAVRTVHATFSIEPWERQAVVRLLADRALPFA